LSVRVERVFEEAPESVGEARAFVAAALTAWDLDDLTEVAMLLTSELTTNAVRHARTLFRVAVERRPSELLVEVTDDSHDGPQRRPPSLDTDGGRGLILVDALATSWGCRETAGGKVVWFALKLD
jgi:anti-sigma regulatory factor (Ser/Thr protein kinase)